MSAVPLPHCPRCRPMVEARIDRDRMSGITCNRRRAGPFLIGLGPQSDHPPGSCHRVPSVRPPGVQPPDSFPRGPDWSFSVRSTPTAIDRHCRDVLPFTACPRRTASFLDLLALLICWSRHFCRHPLSDRCPRRQPQPVRSRPMPWHGSSIERGSRLDSLCHPAIL